MAVSSKVSIVDEHQRIVIAISHKGCVEMLSFLVVFGVVVWALITCMILSNQATYQVNVLFLVLVIFMLVIWILMGFWYFCGIEQVVLSDRQLIHRYQLFFLSWRKAYPFNSIRQVRLTTDRDFERSVGGAPWAKIFHMRIALVHGLDWALLGQNLSDKDAENMVSLIRGALEQQ